MLAGFSNLLFIKLWLSICLYHEISSSLNFRLGFRSEETDYSNYDNDELKQAIIIDYNYSKL